MTKFIVNGKQGYKTYHDWKAFWGMKGAPSTPPVPPGPDPTEPFYVESRGEAMDVSIKRIDNYSTPKISVEYSWDKTTWQFLGNTGSYAGAPTVNVPAGGKVWLRASVNGWASSGSYYNYITTSSPSNVGGNIMSLLYGSNFTGQQEFPSTTTYIFSCLFRNDSSGIGNIVDASKLLLPATTLANYCYYGMFSGCTSLTEAPELPATTLANYCYQNMFYNCTSLTTAPALPATTLAQSCYYQMFSNCTSLTTAPELPATTLVSNCYHDMFYKCTSLTIAPTLPATTLTQGCYYGMFLNCSNLNYIKCLATDMSAGYCLSSWVLKVASSGTFVKKSGVTWPTGADGIPSGWTVVEV